jgi:hypothetical protein
MNQDTAIVARIVMFGKPRRATVTGGPFHGTLSPEEYTMDKLELVTVYAAQGMLAAEVIKGKLQSVGIPALLAYESLGPIYGLTVDGLGLVRVQVPQRFAEDARELIREADGDAGDDDVADDAAFEPA